MSQTKERGFFRKPNGVKDYLALAGMAAGIALIAFGVISILL